MSMVLDDDDAARVAIKEDGAPNTVRPTECLIGRSKGNGTGSKHGDGLQWQRW